METGEKGRQADGEEVWVVTGGDEGCMISSGNGHVWYFRWGKQPASIS